MQATKQERPSLTGFRLYEKQREMVRKLAQEKGVSRAQIVREAIEKYATT